MRQPATGLRIEMIAQAQKPSRTRPVLVPVYDPALKGTTHAALGKPFPTQVNDSFFRKSVSYPRGETIADGALLFVEVNTFNNSDRALQIFRLTLRDCRGKTDLTAICRRCSKKAISASESLNPAVVEGGGCIFDVLSLAGFDALPLRYKLLIANSRHTIEVEAYKMEQ